jgi:zinc transporter 1/2/3
VFHQLVEGVGLGSVIAAAGFAKLKAILMVIVYSITTPVGVAIGIGVSESLDLHSRNAIIVKGSLDGIAAGLLLHIGLVHLICPDFGSGDAKPWKRRIMAYAALLAGGACMAVLAKWA